ncbi:MAG: biotin transporter BioY [Firmicutes bacterium]|nr:biotin transporter BioY [Bacillota bacterium]
MILCAIFAALTAVLAQVSVPAPGGVPVTMQTFAVLLAGIALGSRKGFAATAVYLLLGAAGLPVFAGFSGGFQKFAGPTGGFLLSFPVTAFAAGLSAELIYDRLKGRLGLLFCSLGVLAAVAVNYACGMAVYCAVTGAGPAKAAAVCVLPFIVPDLLKAAGAVAVGTAVRDRVTGKRAAEKTRG